MNLQTPSQSGHEREQGVSSPPVAITEHHIECLAWTKEGKSAPDIGAILGISSRTVEKRLARACKILGVRTRIQAVVKAKDMGLLG